MKPKTKSELMAEWAGRPDQLKREREVKAIRKAMDDARAVMQDGLTRYVKKKTKARSMAKAEADPFAELEGWESMEQIQDAYGYGEITADRRDKITDLWEAREAARNSRKGADKYHDLVTEMLETAIRRVGNEYADIMQGNKSLNEKRIHPTQKPVALYDWIFKNYAKPGQKVLDTHLGSGSSRIAAYEAGIDFIGFEIDSSYFHMEEERFAERTSQMSLLHIEEGR